MIEDNLWSLQDDSAGVEQADKTLQLESVVVDQVTPSCDIVDIIRPAVQVPSQIKSEIPETMQQLQEKEEFMRKNTVQLQNEFDKEDEELVESMRALENFQRNSHEGNDGILGPYENKGQESMNMVGVEALPENIESKLLLEQEIYEMDKVRLEYIKRGEPYKVMTDVAHLEAGLSNLRQQLAVQKTDFEVVLDEEQAAADKAVEEQRLKEYWAAAKVDAEQQCMEEDRLAAERKIFEEEQKDEHQTFLDNELFITTEKILDGERIMTDKKSSERVILASESRLLDEERTTTNQQSRKGHINADRKVLEERIKTADQKFLDKKLSRNSLEKEPTAAINYSRRDRVALRGNILKQYRIFANENNLDLAKLRATKIKSRTERNAARGILFKGMNMKVPSPSKYTEGIQVDKGEEKSHYSDKINANSFDDAITHRYTCSRFQKHDESSIEHQQVISDALQILDVARRAPSGFNVQPWRAVMVCSTEAKERLSHYALAHNADRIRDSDCSVVFLADKECGREMSRFGMFLQEQDQVVAKAKNRKPMSKSKVRYTQALVLLFSSGYPIPRWIGAPFSFFVRLGVAAVSVLSRRRILVPSLSSAECWASKNCMLFAMSYILGCASRNLATAPMEGFNAGGVRKVLGIPKRFAIPLIVSTGKPLQQADTISGVEGDVSVSSPKHVYTNRYPMNQVLYQDKYGQDFTIQKH